MKFTTVRLTLWTAGLLYLVVSLLAQPQSARPSVTTVVMENPVTITQIGDLDRRVTALESSKSNDRLIRIETAMETNSFWLKTLLIPLALLCMEAFFRLLAARAGRFSAKQN